MRRRCRNPAGQSARRNNSAHNAEGQTGVRSVGYEAVSARESARQFDEHVRTTVNGCHRLMEVAIRALNAPDESPVRTRSSVS